ncbi:MAG: DUF2812 domain-containing protein [Solibacillus sp.]
MIKLRPNDYWNLAGHESWYMHMAEQGWHLKKVGLLFTHFEEAPKEVVKYRIEVSKKALSDERLDFYEMSGWDYVTSYHYFHVFSSPKSIGAPELHTDPAEQAHTLKDLDHLFFINNVMSIVASLFLIAVSWAVFFLDGVPVLKLMDGNNLIQLVLVLAMLVQAIHCARAAYYLRKLKQELQSGKSVQHVYKPYKWQHHSWSVFALVVGVLCCVGAVLQFILPERATFTGIEQDISVVRLADLEQSGFIKDEDWHRNIDYANQYEKSWSPFTSRQYEVTESGLIPGKQWVDGSGDYSPSIQTEYYKVLWSALAQPLTRDLAEWYTYDKSHPFEAVTHERFDLLLVRESEGEKELVVASGRDVMFVRYYGHTELAAIVRQIETIVN